MLIKRISLLVLFWALGIANVWGEDDAKSVAQYYDLKPAFVTNFGTGANKLKFVKADVSIRASSEEAIMAVKANEPMIRHQIVMLLSGQADDALSAPTGQESVRINALSLVQEALKEETGKPQIDDLLFTSFVVQR